MGEVESKEKLIENTKEMHHQLEMMENQLNELIKAMFADPDMPDLEKVQDLDPKILQIVKEMQLILDEMRRRMDILEEINVRLELLDEMDEELKHLIKLLEPFENLDFIAMYHNILEQMNVEAIKIYRNLQAVIVEEDAKQNHVLMDVNSKSDKLKGRMNHVMMLSIISFVVSILVMIVTILPQFGISFIK